jgi:hypothetical protein
MNYRMVACLCAFALLRWLPIAFAQEPEKALVGYWPFEEAAGLNLKDASGGGHDGLIMNESHGVRRVPGRSGGALEFDGGDTTVRGQSGAAVLPGMGEMPWRQGLTVALWLKLNKLDRPATYELLSNSKDDRGPGFRFMIGWLSLWLRSGEGGNGKTWGAGTESANWQLRTDQWYHLAATYDAERFRVYIDGALAAESEPLPLTDGESNLYLGSYRGGYAYGLHGVIDEVRLYNYARSPAEIMLDARLL